MSDWSTGYQLLMQGAADGARRRQARAALAAQMGLADRQLQQQTSYQGGLLDLQRDDLANRVKAQTQLKDYRDRALGLQQAEMDLGQRRHEQSEMRLDNLFGIGRALTAPQVPPGASDAGMGVRRIPGVVSPGASMEGPPAPTLPPVTPPVQIGGGGSQPSDWRATGMNMDPLSGRLNFTFTPRLNVEPPQVYEETLPDGSSRVMERYFDPSIGGTNFRQVSLQKLDPVSESAMGDWDSLDLALNDVTEIDKFYKDVSDSFGGPIGGSLGKRFRGHLSDELEKSYAKIESLIAGAVPTWAKGIQKLGQLTGDEYLQAEIQWPSPTDTAPAREAKLGILKDKLIRARYRWVQSQKRNRKDVADFDWTESIPDSFLRTVSSDKEADDLGLFAYKIQDPKTGDVLMRFRKIE